LLRAAFPEVPTLPDVGADGLAKDPKVYGLDQWARLASRCSGAGQTIILESAFLQNSVLPSFFGGAPADVVKAVCANIESQIASADPLLIYLRPSDIDQAVARVHRERGAAWAAQNVAYVANFPWARRRGLQGRDAESLVDEILATSSCATLLLVDPQNDWEAALDRIYSAVRS